MKKNVLLVDDENVNNRITEMVLRSATFTGSIDCVANGQEAINFLEDRIEHRLALPDIIFLDINMPILDGFGFISEIQAHPAIDHKAIEIVILSSSFDPKDRHRAQEMGISTFLEKPLDVPSATEIIM